MGKENRTLMSAKEWKRVDVIQKVDDGELSQVKAGKVLELCDRQIRRLVERFRAEGARGLLHRLQGRRGNHRIREKEKILKIYDKKYYDFGPTFASEKLWERDKLHVNHETLREWLLERGEHEWQRRQRPHKKWRERKASFGEMVQYDGSHHDWLEGRGPELVLMCSVDDATGKVYARFYEYEGVKPAFDSIDRYLEKYGVPQSIYLDKHSTYKTTRHKSIFEELNNKGVLTQFERAMKELGVRVIHANSPQAKGRVENRFKTFQDRLVKEMRLAGIKTLAQANKFLERYLPKFNKRFSVSARNKVDLHCKRPSRYILDSILSIKDERSLRRDSTVYHNKKVYLVTNRISRRVSKVTVEERLDGSIKIKHKGKYLKYREIEPSLLVKPEGEVISRTSKRKSKKKSCKPAKGHPWRNYKRDHYIDSCDYESLMGEKALANV